MASGYFPFFLAWARSLAATLFAFFDDFLLLRILLALLASFLLVVIIPPGCGYPASPPGASGIGLPLSTVSLRTDNRSAKTRRTERQ